MLTEPALPGSQPRLRLNGLMNMRKRLQEIGGRCEIQSAPGYGTQVNFVLLAEKNTP